MAYRLRTLTNFIIGILLTALFLFIAFRGTDFAVLRSIIQEVNIWWVLTAIPILMASHYVRAWRWQLILIPVKDRVKRNNAFSTLMIGYLANNLVPRAGEIVRPYTLGKIENISKASSLGSVFIERMIDLLSMIIGLGLLFAIFRNTLTDQFPWWNKLNAAAVILTVAFIIAVALLLYKRTFIFRIMSIFLAPLPRRLRERIEEIFHSFIDGMLIVRHRKNILPIIGLTLIMWILYIYAAYLPLFAFNMGDMSVDLLTGFVLTMVTSLSVIVPTPGATGSYHTLTVETLTRLFGVQREVALGYATLTHAAGYFSVIFVGLWFLLRYNIKFKDVIRQVESDDPDNELNSLKNDANHGERETGEK